MAQMDLSPVPDPLKRPIPQPAFPVAQGAPEQPQEQSPAVLPQVPVPRGTAAPQPAQTSRLAFPQVGIPNETQNQATLRQTQAQGSGISRIHNPVLKTLATVGDVLAGTFAPRAEQLIPGTEGNYALHLARAGNAVKGEEESGKAQSEQALQRAQAREHEANATSIEEQGKRAPKGNFITVGDGLYDAENNKWVREPTEKNEDKTTEVRPDIAEGLGIVPNSEGRYLVPNQALGALLKPKSETGPKTLTEKWIADYPKGTADDLQAFLAKQPKESQLSADDEAILKAVGGDPRVDIRDQPLQVVNKFLAKKKEHIQNPPQPPIVLVPNESGMMVPTQAKLGVPLPANFGTVSGTAAANTKAAEGQANAKAALDYGVSYLKSGQFTGPGDEALMEKYFELAKPSSGFRMSQPQIDMLLHARSWMGSAEGIAYHAKSGEWFPPDQRKQIVDTMANLGAAKGIKSEGGGGAKTIPYKIGNKSYDIPADQEKDFLRDHPEAKPSGR